MLNFVKIYNKDNFKSFVKKNGENNHIVLTILQTSTVEEVQDMIITFMEKKSNMYKNVFFIIYFIDNVDYIIKKFNVTANELPYIMYIYDNTNILVDVTLVNTLKPLKESFSVMKEYYDETN